MNDTAAPIAAPPAHPADVRLFSPGRKCILTLDGGGCRGIVSVAFLIEMERQLRQATGKADLVLSDVFDMICGTSVGSMLATMLALGAETKDIDKTFRELAPKIFNGRDTIFGQKHFSADPLVKGVRSIVKDATLGSDRLKTGLGIVAKRADTGAVWLLTNNSRMPYYEDGKDFDGNRRYKLETLIRASTAAPFLFTPAKVPIHTDRTGKVQEGYFIDGGVSPHNNPSLLMLLMAGMSSYKLNWSLTPDDLMMISVGTGFNRTPVNRRAAKLGWWARRALPVAIRQDIEEAIYATQTLRGMIADSGLFVLKTMQSLSHPRFSWAINSEVGDLDGQLLLATANGLAAGDPGRGLLKFQRYDLPLEIGCVKPAFNVETTAAERLDLLPIDDPAIIDKLSTLATSAAKKQVSMEDFAGFI